MTTGEIVRRGKALDFQRMQLNCPPVCARFLLGGTCDRVLTVSDSDLPKDDYFG